MKQCTRCIEAKNKGNVGTFWMLLVWDILQIYEPELCQKIYNWVIDKYQKRAFRAETYVETLIFFKAFGMNNTAKKGT